MELIMHNLTEIQKTIKLALDSFGFYTQFLKLDFGQPAKAPLIGEKQLSAESWSGFYHIFNANGFFAVYSYNGKSNEGKFHQTDYQYYLVEKQVEEKEPIASILGRSKIEALSDPKHISEMARLGDQINKIKQSKGLSIEQHDQIDCVAKGLSIKALYDQSQVLEDRMCSYASCFRGLSIDQLQGVRIVDERTSVDLGDGVAHVFSKGDLIICYNDNKSEPENWVVKMGADSHKHKESYIGDNLQNFKIFGAGITDQTKWIGICDNFLSANAIQHATNSTVVAVAKDSNMGKLKNYLKTLAPKANIVFYRSEPYQESQSELIKKDARSNVFHVFLDASYESWCSLRDFLYIDGGSINDDRFVNYMKSLIVHAKSLKAG